MDIPDQRGIEKRLRFLPEIITGLAVSLCVGNQRRNQLQNVLLRMDVGERVIVHRLLEIDRVEHLDPVMIPLQQLAAFD